MIRALASAAALLAACADPTIVVGRQVPPAQGAQPLAAPCVRTGCNGQLCADVELDSTCDAQPTDACYANAACTRQADGRCAFTEDQKLKACLVAARPALCTEGGGKCIPFVEQNCKEGTWLDLKEHSCEDRIGEGCCLPTRTLTACESAGGKCIAPTIGACAEGEWRSESCGSTTLSCCGPKP